MTARLRCSQFTMHLPDVGSMQKPQLKDLLCSSKMFAYSRFKRTKSSSIVALSERCYGVPRLRHPCQGSTCSSCRALLRGVAVGRTTVYRTVREFVKRDFASGGWDLWLVDQSSGVPSSEAMLPIM